MYCRYNGSLARQYSIRTAEAILDNYFTEFVFCGLSCSGGVKAWRCFRALLSFSFRYFFMRKSTQKCPEAMPWVKVEYSEQGSR